MEELKVLEHSFFLEVILYSNCGFLIAEIISQTYKGRNTSTVQISSASSLKLQSDLINYTV